MLYENDALGSIIWRVIFATERTLAAFNSSRVSVMDQRNPRRRVKHLYRRGILLVLILVEKFTN